MKRITIVIVLILYIGSVQGQDVTYPCGHVDIFNAYQIMVDELSEAVPAVDAQDVDGFFTELEGLVEQYIALRNVCYPDEAVPPIARQATARTSVEAAVYYALGSVNTRTCASTTCPQSDGLAFGDAIAVSRFEEGEAVNGSTRWAAFHQDGEEVYVHSSLISVDEPPPLVQIVQAPPPTPVPQVQQVQQPVQQAPPPVVQQPPPPTNQTQTFSSSQYGYDAVIQVTIPKGVYIFRLSTSGFITVTITKIEGDCPIIWLATPYQNTQPVVEQDSATAYSDCRALLNVDNYSDNADWTVTIERVN